MIVYLLMQTSEIILKIEKKLRREILFRCHFDAKPGNNNFISKELTYMTLVVVELNQASISWNLLENAVV